MDIDEMLCNYHCLYVSGRNDVTTAEFSSQSRLPRPAIVFPNRRGDGPWSYRESFGAACKAAQVVDFRWHDLRHSAASALLLSGASIREIADVLGHRTLAMVMRYSHIADEHKRKVVERMNEAAFGERS